MLFLAGCCDCVDPVEGDPPLPFCSPREATITRFNSDFTSKIDTDQDGVEFITYLPQPEYNIHGLRMPDQLIVDDRFDAENGINKISIDEEGFPIEGNLLFAVLSEFPLNEDLKADIIVTDVDLGVTRSASLRFAGRLNFYEDNLISESSQDFCDYIEVNGADMQSIPLVLYGEGISDNNGNISTKSNFSGLPVSLISSSGSILIEDVDNPDPNRFASLNDELLSEVEIANNLETLLVNAGIGNNFSDTEQYRDLLARINQTEYKAIDIEVNTNDVFIYESINGKRYAINIIDIGERFTNAVKTRVSIQFTEL